MTQHHLNYQFNRFTFCTKSMSIVTKLFTGPTPLPFIGNLLTITQELEGAFIKWRREYGPVYSKSDKIDELNLLFSRENVVIYIKYKTSV